MDFVVTGLDPAPFRPLYGMSERGLSSRGVVRMTVDAEPGYPDRIEMRDASIGETVLLLNHVSLDVRGPYRASHAIFIREGAQATFRAINEIPEVLYRRTLSLRAFDSDGMMVDATLATGDEIGPAVSHLLERSDTAFIHAHNAIRGCYAGRIERL
ncbi:MAG: DUF1203 domain-containing protein [Geminicoccaceae bacterium]